MRYDSTLYKIYNWLAKIPPKIKLRTRKPLSPEQKRILINKLASGYYIILTGNNSHLSSLIVKFMTLLKLQKKASYSHVLMNCDFMDDPEDVYDFKFMEATVAGVHYSIFEEVFDCDSVCLLSPKNLTNKQWTLIIDAMVKYQGKPYDDLFQLADESHISCVELIRNGLKDGLPDYHKRFASFERMIEDESNLLPQMFRDCEDFIVIYES